jgi:hypothetical protein
MTSPFPLPDWLPWWVTIAVLVPALLYLLVFLLMPFSVFGLKGRLDSIETRLDEIEGMLAQRLPDPRGRGLEWADPPPPMPPVQPIDEDRPARPPIPPAPVQPPRRSPVEPGYRPAYPEPPYAGEDGGPDEAGETGEPPRRRPVIRTSRPQRNEPRLDWPR